MSSARRGPATSAGRPRSLVGDVKPQQAELEIEVLYRLHTLGADTGVPIEVLRSSDGRVHVSNFGYIDPSFSDLLFGQSTKMLDQSFGKAGALYNQGGPRALQVSVKATF